MSAWQRINLACDAAGDVGGDTQIGEAYTARWARPVQPGVDPLAAAFPGTESVWAVVDCSYYGAAGGTTYGGYEHVAVINECTICTDPDAPYDTELMSWAVYDDVESDENGDVDITDERIRSFAADDPPPENEWWNTTAGMEGHPGMMLAVPR